MFTKVTSMCLDLGHHPCEKDAFKPISVFNIIESQFVSVKKSVGLLFLGEDINNRLTDSNYFRKCTQGKPAVKKQCFW